MHIFQQHDWVKVINKGSVLFGKVGQIRAPLSTKVDNFEVWFDCWHLPIRFWSHELRLAELFQKVKTECFRGFDIKAY